ncbi:Polyamine N-acetyltransferase 1 [Colletotrichum sidae]|uniref:Polyamine N-acetyltransferase 1 n=2 Tax=Colletotrichum orbiculare species complex TaxID=2707354 RepID=N4VUK4_COLOR|nr:Polyamine N-acetyltransferase 1 [Colletotrichum orbiculare MAFF 240422]TEA12849.1 Polyamine N-acetyltransferase 1 [Colletotrichum sidae]
MTAYIRPLSIGDLSQCVAVESAAFPPAEAATPEKIEYRLSVCPELCYGLFVAAGTSDHDCIGQTEIPVLASAPANSSDDKLLAHVISTKSTSSVVKDADMAFPPKWKDNPAGHYDVGHQPQGSTIALHSLAVTPSVQRRGLGKKLMASYTKHMKDAGIADRIAILTYDRLLSYYQSLGFTHYGKSASEYAGVAWHDLAYEFSA